MPEIQDVVEDFEQAAANIQSEMEARKTRDGKVDENIVKMRAKFAELLERFQQLKFSDDEKKEQIKFLRWSYRFLLKN
jgi:hypothetical protein